jgi:hypothetical protein
MQPGVLCLVNNTHAAAAESLKDAVVREGLADERIGAWHVRHLRLEQWGKSMNGTQVGRREVDARPANRAPGYFWQSVLSSSGMT